MRRARPDPTCSFARSIITLSLSHARTVAPFLPLSLSFSPRSNEVALGLLALDRARTRVARSLAARPTRAGRTLSVAEFVHRGPS